MLNAWERDAASIAGQSANRTVGARPRLHSPVVGRRDTALLAIGYFFALRRSELVALDLDRQGDGDAVLKITAKTIELAFATSKTSTGEPEVVAVPREMNGEAVKAIEAWIKLARILPGDAVLRRVTKGGKIGGRLHAQSVAHIVKARIAELVLNTKSPVANPSI